MKILEACANGIPFVSTRVGAEGLPVENGKDCFITDNPDEFVKDIIKLQDQELQKKFITNANLMVLNNFSLDSLRLNRKTIYENILQG
jgi:glycosyltransferase involved in cell wall biosynthesis